jgi:protein TonB
MDPEPRGCRGRGRQTQVSLEGKTMFEHSLIDLDNAPRLRRRWISLPIAIGLHVVGLTAIAFASYWSVGEVPEPQTNAVFLSFAPLPELPGGGGGPRPQVKPPVTQDQEKPQTPEKPVQPTVEDVPATVPTPAAPENVVPSTVTSDDNTGPRDGPPCPACSPGPGFGPGPGGPGTGPGSGDGPADSQPLVFSVGKGMTRPEIVHQVKPRYTELGRQSGTQGAVIVEAIIDEQGRVTNVRVLRGLPMGLDQAAVDAIQQWRFKPATLQGQPVKVYYTLTVNFTI